MSPQKSTTVRLFERPTPARPHIDRRQEALRAVFARLDATAPAASARLAAYLWFRLARPPEPARRRRRMPVGGWPLELDVPGVGRIRGLEFGPDEGPVALLVHGWAGWREQLSAYIEPLTAQGFRVIGYDAPSHGESGAGRHGRRSSTVLEMAEVLAAVAGAVGPVRLVIAHSLGAMALAWEAARSDLRIGAAVLIAPAASVSPVLDTFQMMCGFGPATRRRLTVLLERRFGRSLAEFDVPAMAAEWAADDPVPMLAVHDCDDAELPASGAEAIAAAWPGAELMLTEGLGHRRILWDPAVVRRVAEFAGQVAAQPA